MPNLLIWTLCQIVLDVAELATLAVIVYRNVKRIVYCPACVSIREQIVAQITKAITPIRHRFNAIR